MQKKRPNPRLSGKEEREANLRSEAMAASRAGEGRIAGRNAVMEALRAGRPIECLYITEGGRFGVLRALAAQAREAGIPVKEVSRVKLDAMCGYTVHQGVVAVTAAHAYCEVEEIFRRAQAKGEPPFLLVADGVEDPHNLGAILRTVDCCGAHGVVIPRRRAVGLTSTVARSSAGAIEYVPVARVANIPAFLEELKSLGVWVYAADMDGESWASADLTGPLALVFGAEGSGVSRLVRERADGILSLPLFGHIDSLNVSVACGVLCYEAARQRHGIPAR